MKISKDSYGNFLGLGNLIVKVVSGWIIKKTFKFT